MNLIESLLSCLQQGNTLVTEFSATLEAESEALGDRTNIANLQAIVEHKKSLAAQLAQLSEERDGLLGALGFSSGHQGTQDAVAQHPVLESIWQELLQNAANANEINTHNGLLIELNLQHTQQSLDVLQKIGALSGSNTYDAQGRNQRLGAGSKSIIAR